MPQPMEFVIRPLTPELWPALEDLFGPAGASNGCWCMYWRLGPEYRRHGNARNKAALAAIVDEGPPPGLLAFDRDRSVGWCQLTPGATLPWLERTWAKYRDSDARVWSLSCFYVRRGYRGRGVPAALVAAAEETARQAHASALEAYPVDTSVAKSTRNLFTGTAVTFSKAGFQTAARGPYGRLIMRHDLATPGR